VSVLTPTQAYTLGVLGLTVSKAYTIATETKDLFTVSGGMVLVTSLVGKVTTAMTVANTVKLVANPTTGTSSDLVAATDLGTTDTPAGNLLSISGAPTGSIVQGIGAVGKYPIAKVSADYLGAVDGIYVAAGVIQQVTTGTSPDGAITWYLSYVPIDTGAAVAAA
jgi:hypothetical protein